MSKKKVLSLIFAVALVIVCVFPVSATNYGTLLDWGWYLSLSVSSSSSSLSCSKIELPYTTQGTNNYIIDMFGISLQSGYTYTYTNTVEVSYGGSVSPLSLTRAWYSLSSSDNVNTGSYLDTMLITVEKIDSGKYRLKCVFNVDSSGLLSTDVYFYVPFLKLFYGGSGSKVFSSGNQGLVITYDPGGSAFQQELVDMVAQMKDNQENYFSNALEVLDAIKSNGEATNDKLDAMPGKIGEELDKHDQKVKAEANTEGDDKVNQATSALTNALPIASISDAIAPLITACSYNGITSVWSFPEIRIPAIKGLFGEMKMSDQQNFDLCAYAEQYIPDELLMLIRAVTTLLLIIWAIREVQGLLHSLLGGDG